MCRVLAISAALVILLGANLAAADEARPPTLFQKLNVAIRAAGMSDHFLQAAGAKKSHETTHFAPDEVVERDMRKTLKILKSRAFIPRRATREVKPRAGDMLDGLDRAFAGRKVELGTRAERRRVKAIGKRLLRVARSLGYEGPNPRFVAYRATTTLPIDASTMHGTVFINVNSLATADRVGAAVERGTSDPITSVIEALGNTAATAPMSARSRRLADAIIASSLGHELAHLMRGDTRVLQIAGDKHQRFERQRGYERAADIGAVELSLRAGYSPLGVAVNSVTIGVHQHRLPRGFAQSDPHPGPERYGYTERALRRLAKTLPLTRAQRRAMRKVPSSARVRTTIARRANLSLIGKLRAAFAPNRIHEGIGGRTVVKALYKAAHLGKAATKRFKRWKRRRARLRMRPALRARR